MVESLMGTHYNYIIRAPSCYPFYLALCSFQRKCMPTLHYCHRLYDLAACFMRKYLVVSTVEI